MTVLSRSKNAAERVTVHEGRRPHPRNGRSAPSTPERVIHRSAENLATVARPGWARPVIATRSAARPLVVATDETLLDDCLRVLAAAGAEPEVATGGSALRRAHREGPLVLLGAEVLTAAPVRALPRRPAVVVVSGAPLPADG